MVRHVVDSDQFLTLRCHDSGDVLLQFVVVNGIDEVLPAFHGEHDLNVDLSICVGPRSFLLLIELKASTHAIRPLYVSALRASGTLRVPFSTKMSGLTALRLFVS